MTIPVAFFQIDTGSSYLAIPVPLVLDHTGITLLAIPVGINRRFKSRVFGPPTGSAVSLIPVGIR